MITRFSWRMNGSALILTLLLPAAAGAASGEGSFTITNTDFASLYNHGERSVQPNQVPWAGSYFAYGKNGIADETEQSPSYAARYDKVFGRGTQSAAKWELAHHSCDAFAEQYREGCRAWWGHCNAWSAAAIKEPEPRTEISHSSGETFTVGDQKAYLTELWMDSHSLFAGSTNKDVKTSGWIYDPQAPESIRAVGYGSGTTFEAFWDVTPRAFFMILTNYVGLMGTSVVIDRFTGNEVWNQPLAGYRLLPIRPEDRLEPETLDGRTLYPVILRAKIYWANDGVRADHVTQGFDIKKTTDDESVSFTWPNDVEYAGRFLAFTLFFDAPVETSPDGTKVLSAGKIMGEGLWRHQQYSAANPDRTHPDFIWLPTRLSTGGGSANPHIDSSTVRALAKSQPAGSTNLRSGEPHRMTVTLDPGVFLMRRDPALAARMLRTALAREGVEATIRATDVSWLSGGSLRVSILLEDSSDRTRVRPILSEAGF